MWTTAWDLGPMVKGMQCGIGDREREHGIEGAADGGVFGTEGAGEILAEAGARRGVEFGHGVAGDEAFGPRDAELDRGDLFGVGREDGDAGEREFGAEEMAEGLKDLIGLAGALNALGEVEESVDGGGARRACSRRRAGRRGGGRDRRQPRMRPEREQPPQTARMETYRTCPMLEPAAIPYERYIRYRQNGHTTQIGQKSAMVLGCEANWVARRWVGAYIVDMEFVSPPNPQADRGSSDQELTILTEIGRILSSSLELRESFGK